MDENNALSDAEMRLITINGQTIMLEGDFENVNMTNEFLNEMLMVSNPKVGLSDECNVQLNGDSCVNPVKELSGGEPTKFEISIQGENNEMQTVQIGIEEAKSLGLCFYGEKNLEIGTWESCSPLGENEEPMIKVENCKVNGHSELEKGKVKLHSVPVKSVTCPAKEEETLVSVNEVNKFNGESFMYSKPEKVNRVIQEDSTDSLPAIGHLEGFQIPTSEDGVLLPATVNARMADGSYQIITLVPQVVNGAVTYTVHFSGLGDKNLSNYLNFKNQYSESLCNGVNSSYKEIAGSQTNSVDQFMQSLESEQVKNSLPESVQRLNNSKTSVKSIIGNIKKESVLKVNKGNSFTSANSSVNYTVQNQLPIERKIDNLITENENVISKCKKVKYGKKLKSEDSDASLLMVNQMTKSNIARTKKVKFKSKEIKFSNEDDEKKVKLSLLKTNKKPADMSSKVSSVSAVPHMNLNGRLEYPNLKAIEETASPFSYLKVKTSHATKQPYFNVLPYPKDKTIPVQKQILPLNCDLQQAKNLISLQKFLETQKLELKIQPIVNKTINIRPKPPLKEEPKVFNVSNASSKTKGVAEKEKVGCDDARKKDSQGSGSDDELGNKAFQDTISINDVFLSDGKLKSAKSPNSETVVENEKDQNSTKLNSIFIKNNPEYFSQKFKDGKADEHPLGSSENPIQLVQTGHTFHSRQPLSETQLRQIASILQKQKFDSPNVKKNSIFDPKTNTRIVYRVVYPEDVELKDCDRNSTEGITKRKRGRHKTKLGVEDDIQKKPSPLPRGPGRPKKNPSAIEEDLIEDEIEDQSPKKKIPRTRSGRLSRPPRYMVKDYKRLRNSDASEKTSNSNYDSDEAYSAYQNEEKVPLEPTDSINDLEIESNLMTGLRPQQRSKRNFKPEYRCPTCQKIYLGHTRMMWHLNKFPDHCNVEKYKENYYRNRTETKVRRAARRLNLCDVTNKVKQVLNSMSKDELTSLCGPILAEALTIWDFLLLRVNLLKANRKDEVDALLHELVLLLEKLTKIAEDIFLPVFTKEAEKDDDCVEIDRMELAIALGIPVGFYKINNDNLDLLKFPLKNLEEPKEEDEKKKEETKEINEEVLFLKNIQEQDTKRNIFEEKPEPWEDEDKNSKNDSFWLETKEDTNEWHAPENKPLSTKFEPNLSTKILESSNDSIDDSKYEEPVQLLDLDSNSKDVDQSNSPHLEGCSDISLEKETPKIAGEKRPEIIRSKEKHSSELWNENSEDKVSGELWSENASRGKWVESSDMVQAKSTSELWANENSEMATGSGKPAPPHLWSENSNLTSSEKVDDTNSEFLDSLLSVPNSNEFLANESGGFLAENIALINDKNESLKGAATSVNEAKKKRDWKNNGGNGSYWETGKNSTWQKEESLLSATLQERMPGVRTATRLTSTPETNANVSFDIPNRRNSISDFSNINLESGNLDIVLPPAKTLIKDCLKDDEKFEMKASDPSSYLETSGVKNWEAESSKTDFASTNVNSEDLMKMALESLTSQHDVISVPSSSFDSAMGILNQSQESNNLNLFTSSESDALDFNLPLPDHLLRSNFEPTNFQTTCAPNFPSSEPPPFLSAGNNIFGATCANSMDQFDANYSNKKEKSLDDVMEFFETKNSFNGYNTGEDANINSFTFGSVEPPQPAVEPQPAKKQTKVRVKKQSQKNLRTTKSVKKGKVKKTVDYPKSNTIESIINEALFESCPANSKSLQMENSSPNSNSTIPNRTENFSLPIIPESLDEVENLDFLNQD